jgi:hypothetical protein
LGLSFHYSGRIANPEQLPELIDEIKDVAKAFNWKYFIYERQFQLNTYGKSVFNQEIYGISFTPTNCETIDVCFLSNGRMSGPANLSFWGAAVSKPECDYLYMLSVKTQFAGIETHLFIIQLFRYLSKKYFTDFNLSDEGQYWETNDESILRANFKKYTDLIDSVSLGLENIPIKPNENMEAYLVRLMNLMHNKRNTNK